MPKLSRAFLAILAMLCSCLVAPFASAQTAPSIDSRFADVDGLKLHYLVAGQGLSLIHI